MSFGEGFATGLSKTIGKTKGDGSNGSKLSSEIRKGVAKISSSGKSGRSQVSSSGAAAEYPGVDSGSSDDGE
jgi:hypothetical protein